MNPVTFPRKITAIVLYHAGLKEDDEDTMQCARGIAEALIRRGHTAHLVAVTKQNWRTAIKTPGDVVFNLVEDDHWELYTKVGMELEKLHRAQVGHDLKDFKYVIKKAWIKKHMKKWGIATPKFTIYTRRSQVTNKTLRYPLIVKPSEQHAGIGISQSSVVRDEAALQKQVKQIFSEFPGVIVAEEFIKGREVHVTVIGNGKNLFVLPLCEIGYSGKFTENWNIYTYSAKWQKDSWEYSDARVQAPANVSPALAKKITALAKKTHIAFGCRDVVRMDIRIDEHEMPYVIDINTNPSLNYFDEEDATLRSVYAMKWTYDEFIETVTAISYKRHNGSLR